MSGQTLAILELSVAFLLIVLLVPELVVFLPQQQKQAIPSEGAINIIRRKRAIVAAFCGLAQALLASHPPSPTQTPEHKKNRNTLQPTIYCGGHLVHGEICLFCQFRSA